MGSITIKYLLSLNQLFDFFILIESIYLKNLVKVMISQLSTSTQHKFKARNQPRKEQQLGFQRPKRELTNIASFLIFCSYMQHVLYHYLPGIQLQGSYLQLANCWRKLFFPVCVSSSPLLYKISVITDVPPSYLICKFIR